MQRLARVVFAAWIGLAAGTSCSSVQCGAPSQVTYSCEPLPAGEPGCSGGTVHGSVPDPSLTFAEGCEIAHPFCHAFYPTSVATCRCARGRGVDGGAAFNWICPL